MHESENYSTKESAVMSNQANIQNNQQELERLSRKGSLPIAEKSVLVSAGTGAGSWAGKVESLSSYNVYNVCLVEINEAGFVPSEIGQNMQAYNLAESFIATGTLAVGTYVVVAKVGEKNIFYAPV